MLDHREGPLQEKVEQYLSLTGWLWFHDRATNFAHMNNAGFPDIVAVHPKSGVVVFLELKGAKGKLSDEQKEWRDALLKHPSPTTHHYSVVRPADFDRLIEALDKLRKPIPVEEVTE